MQKKVHNPRDNRRKKEKLWGMRKIIFLDCPKVCISNVLESNIEDKMLEKYNDMHKITVKPQYFHSKILPSFLKKIIAINKQCNYKVNRS